MEPPVGSVVAAATVSGPAAVDRLMTAFPDWPVSEPLIETAKPGLRRCPKDTCCRNCRRRGHCRRQRRSAARRCRARPAGSDHGEADRQINGACRPRIEHVGAAGHRDGARLFRDAVGVRGRHDPAAVADLDAGKRQSRGRPRIARDVEIDGLRGRRPQPGADIGDIVGVCRLNRRRGAEGERFAGCRQVPVRLHPDGAAEAGPADQGRPRHTEVVVGGQEDVAGRRQRILPATIEFGGPTPEAAVTRIVGRRRSRGRIASVRVTSMSPQSVQVPLRRAPSVHREVAAAQRVGAEVRRLQQAAASVPIEPAPLVVST